MVSIACVVGIERRDVKPKIATIETIQAKTNHHGEQTEDEEKGSEEAVNRRGKFTHSERG